MMRSLLIVAALLAGGSALLVFAFAGGDTDSRDAVTAVDDESQQNSADGSQRQQGAVATENDQNAGTEPNANDSAGKKMLLDVARRLARSEPFEARLRYRINLLDQRISGPGVYYQSGKGGNKAKIVFQSGTANPEMLFEQFTDGRLFYTHYKMPGDERLEFIDLDRVKELPKEHNSFMPGLSAWVAGGGLGGLLEHVAFQFQLGQPQRTTVDDRTLTTVSGDWKPEALARLYEGQVDQDRFARDDWWKYLPTHLPHRVSITVCET